MATYTCPSRGSCVLPTPSLKPLPRGFASILRATYTKIEASAHPGRRALHAAYTKDIKCMPARIKRNGLDQSASRPKPRASRHPGEDRGRQSASRSKCMKTGPGGARATTREHLSWSRTREDVSWLSTAAGHTAAGSSFCRSERMSAAKTGECQRPSFSSSSRAPRASWRAMTSSIPSRRSWLAAAQTALKRRMLYSASRTGSSFRGKVSK